MKIGFLCFLQKLSMNLFLQGLGLYWLGQEQRKGFFVHIGLSLFWPIALGLAQLPIIFNGEPYRTGIISKVYVFGMIVVGLLMLFHRLRR